jgi:hypothetical protein
MVIMKVTLDTLHIRLLINQIRIKHKKREHFLQFIVAIDK